MLIVSNLIPRRHPGGFPKFYFDMKFWNFSKFSKNTTFSNQNRASGGLLEASWVSDLEKGTSQLSLEKKISLYLRKKFRFRNVSCIKVSMGTHFQMCYIVVFSAFFERKSKLQTKIQLRKASWRPPGFQIWKKQYYSFHWKKIIPLSFFLNKIKICKHKYSETDWFCWKNDRYGISENRCRTSLWWKIHCKTSIFSNWDTLIRG